MEMLVDHVARAAALSALTDDHRKTLVADARFRARGTLFESGDLLNGAYERWMASEKPVTGASETCAFLRGAIRSIASNERRHAAMVRRIEGDRVVAADGEPDPVDAASDPAASQEDDLLLGQLYELCSTDSDVQTLLMFQAEGAGRADVLRDLDWDVTKYETVQKRKRKMVARLINEGRI